MRLFGALLTVASLCAIAAHQADMVPHHARGGSMYRSLLKEKQESQLTMGKRLGLPSWAPNSVAYYKDTVLDHVTGQGSYRQRFFFDTTFCGSKCNDPSTPIICEFTGEWTASAAPDGAAAELAQKLGALTCTLEHRFYGCSRPEGGCIPARNQSNMVRFLSVEQAIEDAADFIAYFEAFAAGEFSPAAAAAAPKHLPSGFVPARKWGIVGGSYAGAYVSWVTVRHGDLLSATWSSSGVVNAIYNFTAFDATVGAALGGDCSDALREVMGAFERAWQDDAKRLQMLQLFHAADGFHTAGDFAWLLADSAGMAPQYGSKSKLCTYLNSTARATPSSPSPPNPGYFLRGWAALEAFAQWTNDHYGTTFGSSCYYSTKCLADPASVKSDTTTWVWQCCSELAYWNVAQLDGAPSVRSGWVNASYFESQCHAAFHAYNASAFPDTVAFDARFGGSRPFVGAHRVFATQGSDDPWQGAGVNQNISDTYLESTAYCQDCSHCRDLSGSMATDPPPLTNTRQQVMAAMEAWMRA